MSDSTENRAASGNPASTEACREQTADAPAHHSPQPGKQPSVVIAPPAPEPESRWDIVKHKALQALSSMSVRYKIAGTVIIILSLAVGTLGIVTFSRQSKTLRNEMQRRGAVLAHQLANVGKECLLTKQDLPVYAHIADIQDRDKVVYAIVTDAAGKVVAHSDLAKKGSVLSGDPDRAALKAQEVLIQEIRVSGQDIMETAVPIMMKAQSMKIGVARIGLSMKELNEAISGQKRLYLWLSLGFIAAGLVIGFSLAHRLTTPLSALAEGIQFVSRGDLRRLVPVTSNDEIGKVTNFFNQMVLSLREKIHMEKYLSQSTVNNIRAKRDISEMKLGGERKYVVAFFSDARGFTALSEKLSPEEVVSLMNTYLNLQTIVIHKYGGVVDKFVGDEVMAIFDGGEGMELNAVRAATEIQSYCTGLNAARAAAGETTINIGIGINGGEVVMGNMGSENQMDYTVIGDNINLAARLCGIAQPGQVLISRTIMDKLGGQTACKELPPVSVKGKDKPIPIAEVAATPGGTRRYMRKEMDFTVTFSLEGYEDESNTAVVKNISAGGCLLEIGTPLAIGSKLLVNINIPTLGNLRMRTTVVHAKKLDRQYYVGMTFEHVEERLLHDLIRWVHRVNTGAADGMVI